MPKKLQKNFIFDFMVESKYRVWRHLLFILLFLPIAFGMSFSVFSGHVNVLGNKVYLFGVCLAILPILFVYFNLKVLIPRYFAKNRYGVYIVSFLTFTLIFLIATYLARHIILETHGIKEAFNVYVVLDGLSNLMLYTICIASSSITALLQQWTNDTNKINDLENAWLKSSLDELKNSINPKFLYGVLDHSSEVVKTEPGKASAILLKLSELLRYELYDCKRKLVLLKSDILFIENYLSLEQQSSEGKFAYTMSTVGKADYFLPPFIFMPFIQEIMVQKPSRLTIEFAVKAESIHFILNVIGIDLSSCNFLKVEQKLIMLYGNDFNIKTDRYLLELMLKKL